ncbi:MAG: hypothetical protein HQL52_02695 [Magnetococcales bacterium]|nr:hypothetical protein [Magnetococcales bacterium]
MAEVVPRWEWRTFGADFSEAAKRLAQLGSARVRESAEVYLISSKSHENTKIRQGLMDIKTLCQVNDQKLEQWIPALKTGFPLQRDLLDRLFKTWQVEPLALSGDEWDLDSFLSQVVDSHPHLARVDVFKERHGYLIEDCIIEVAYLKFDGEPIQTVAVEMEEADRVWERVVSLGLADRENVNYVSALKRFKGIG